ncbi:hypothetical protein MKW92_003687 [Papaver armeniacum]|nr:hypothetical protein MKW92_003687 [Papaver armeniacum]
MENTESAKTEEKLGCFYNGKQWIKALPLRALNNVVEFGNKVKNLAKDDPRRVTHSIKVGLALSLVSLLFYFRTLYGSFGAATMWAVLTVVVVFEFSVATLAGDIGEPILLCLFVFLLAAASSFSRFFPTIKARYDYGVLIFILTFSLVSVSGYRVEKIIELAHQRLSTIIVGSCTCILISIFVCPVWAGKDLHNLISMNIEKLGDFLQGFEEEYFGKNENEENVLLSQNKKPLCGYKSVLTSMTAEESLANFAKWEPPHGRFRFRHPWNHYLKIGAITRQCACQMEALNGCINSEIQASSQEFKKKIQETCTKMTFESSKALMELSSSIKTMTHPQFKTELLQIIPTTTVISLLIEIITYIERISESVHELSRSAKFRGVADSTAIVPVSDGEDSIPHVILTVHEITLP